SYFFRTLILGLPINSLVRKSYQTALNTKNKESVLRFPCQVPSAGVEPAHPKILVFETNASTNSASWASCFVVRRCKYKSSWSVCKNIFACFVKLLCIKQKKIKI